MRARLITGVLTLVSLTCLSAQTPPRTTPAPTFRGDANYVRIDMFATERDRPVDDLTADDVEVLEDGARQTIVAFEHVSIPSSVPAGTGSATPPAELNSGEPNNVSGRRQLATAARSRVFVVFIDTHHTQLEASSMRLPLVKFLDQLLGPDDLVALMTPEMGGADMTLGRKTTVLPDIMRGDWNPGSRARARTGDDPKDALYVSCYPDNGATAGVAEEMKDRRREMLTLDALDDLVLHVEDLREERKAVITVSDGWLLAGPDQKLARLANTEKKSGIQNPFGRGRRDPVERASAGVVSMTECEADRNALAFVDHRQRARELTDRANRANVTFYPVYPRGLAAADAVTEPGEALRVARDARNLNTRQDSLRQLAIETDGTAIIASSDVEPGLRRIVSDLSSYYLVGYKTTDQKLDGRFRTITVRAKRPGVRVRARRGYRAPTPADLTGGANSPLASPGVAAAFSTVAVTPQSRLRLRTAAWPRTQGDGVAGSVWVVGELDYRLRRDVEWTAGASADVLLVSAAGAELLSTTVDVDPSLGTFTVQVPQDGGLAGGEYALKISVRSKQNGPLPLTETARLIVPSVAATLGEAVMWRRGPTTGPRFLMTADARFQRSDRVRLEHATAASGVPVARLIDQQGKTLAVPVAVSKRPDSSGDFEWVVAEVALAPLAPGSYGIEVGVDAAKAVTAFTVVP